jgi:hypothetical protein
MILRKQNSCWTRFLVIDPFVELISSILLICLINALCNKASVSPQVDAYVFAYVSDISIVNAFLTVRVEPEGRILLHKLSHVGCQS